jgi:hypothetical protein
MNYVKCLNCGWDEGLHKHDTMQCPKGGEVREGIKQEWLKTVYVIDTGNLTENVSILEKRVSLLEKRIFQLEKSKKD